MTVEFSEEINHQRSTLADNLVTREEVLSTIHEFLNNCGCDCPFLYFSDLSGEGFVERENATLSTKSLA